MRPNTMMSGIFSTKRKSPVSTSMLTRMLVPKPKKAFQSLGVQSAGRRTAVVMVMSLPCRSRRPASKAWARIQARAAGLRVGRSVGEAEAAVDEDDVVLRVREAGRREVELLRGE